MHYRALLFVRNPRLKTAGDVFAFFGQDGSVKRKALSTTVKNPKGGKRHYDSVLRFFRADYWSIGGRWSGSAALDSFAIREPAAHKALTAFHKRSEEHTSELQSLRHLV